MAKFKMIMISKFYSARSIQPALPKYKNEKEEKNSEVYISLTNRQLIERVLEISTEDGHK